MADECCKCTYWNAENAECQSNDSVFSGQQTNCWNACDSFSPDRLQCGGECENCKHDGVEYTPQWRMD